MKNQVKSHKKRLLAFLLAALIALSSILINGTAVFAADGTLTFNSGETIAYGDYYTTRMTFDGDNKAYCVEPLKPTPSAGTYEYDLLGNDSPVRKALYYLPGGYGYEKNIQGKYLGGWAEDDAYVIGHLVVAYTYAGYSADSGAFYGAPQSYIDKAVEISNAINVLPDPPKNFRAFLVVGNNNQTITGSWYQKPYGWIELKKTSANDALTDGNGSYSLKGAQYGVYKGEELLETLTTDKNGYAKSKDLEADFEYTVRELKASPGFVVDPNGYKVTVKSETGATVKVNEFPQNNPLDLVLKKLDMETGTNTPQGGAALKDAEFTVKFYASQSDTDPAAKGETPLRTWVFKTDASGEIHFSKEYLVSGDELYYVSGGKTPCLPLGTVTVQESKAPAGYFASDAIFVQKLSGGGDSETLELYHASDVEEQIFRGGVKIQKRDLETGEARPQGGASFENAEFTITSLNENPVLVDGKPFTKDQIVMTLKTGSDGTATTKKDALPYGHYRADEVTPPQGYLNTGKISIACLALCRAALSYDGKRPFEPYAIRAVRNALMDYCRMANRQVNCSLDEPVASGNSTLKDFFEVEADGESAYERLRTSEAFAYLKEQQRQYTGVVQKGISCLIWRAQGYNSKDLSQYFDTSTNSVRAWMSHAAKVLRTEQQLYDLLS